MGHWPRIKQWSLRLAEFGAVQAGVQLLNAIAGLLIVRTLSKHDYALFAVANSMQTTCNQLAEFGLGLRVIGGRVWDDRSRFGSLINTALQLRHSFAVISMAICLPLMAWMMWKNGAPTWTIVAFCGVLFAGVLPSLSASVYAIVPQFHGEYRRIQKLDMGNAALRVALIGALTATYLSGVLAAAVGAVTNWTQLLFVRRWAHQHADPEASPNQDDRREMMRLYFQWLPNVVFFCFQAQVTLLILTLVGSPTAVADVTALGRLAALLGVFSVTFNNVLAPRFARCQDPARLPWLYLLLMGATIALLAPLLVVAWLFPEPLLWLLGSKYASLGAECGWVVTAGCISLLAGVLFNLNSSKAWIRFQSVGFIPAILGAQALAAILLDLRQFHDVLIFNLVTAAAPIPVYLLDAYFGMKAT